MYQPLQLKYRPQVLTDCIGQEPIVRTLTNAINSKKIAPAYLFFGGRGTGKTSTARILAKSLNCLNSTNPTPNPCNKCKACIDITSSNSVDVTEIDGASNTGVDNIRRLAESTHLAPIETRYKIIIIDEVHMLTTQSFNALLKVLEDFKNESSIFILATTDPQKIPDTITSRCQTYNFRQIETSAIFDWLSTISQKEQIKIEDEALKIIAKLSHGGLRDALVMLDQVSVMHSDLIDKSKVKQALGIISIEPILNIVSATLNGQAENIIDGVRGLIEQGKDCLTIVNTLGQFYVDALKVKSISSYDEKLFSIDQEAYSKVNLLLKNIPIESIIASQKEIKSWELQLKHSTQPQLWLEIGLLGLMPTNTPEVVTQPVIPQVPVKPPQRVTEALKTIESKQPDVLLPSSEWEVAISNISDPKIKALLAVTVKSVKLDWQNKKAVVNVKCGENLKPTLLAQRTLLESELEKVLAVRFKVLYIFV